MAEAHPGGRGDRSVSSGTVRGIGGSGDGGVIDIVGSVSCASNVSVGRSVVDQSKCLDFYGCP